MSITFGKPRFVEEDEEPKGDGNSLPKFLVHFRRPDDYRGEFGFDWIRDEYIYPIVKVAIDNNGNPINQLKPLCKDIQKLKNEYLKDTEHFSPYGIQYYPAWLSIFPFTTTKEFSYGSRMHKNGVNLNLEIEEIDAITLEDIKIVFKSTNDFLKITPSEITASEIISSPKKTKNIGGVSKNYYILKKKVNIKCIKGALDKHEQIKVFAERGDLKQQVGKLVVYKNNVIPKAEIVVVNVIKDPSNKAKLRNDYQFLFKYQSFNQALIRAEVVVDTSFNLLEIPDDTDPDKYKLYNTPLLGASEIRNIILRLYEKYGKYKPVGNIDSNNNKRTYLFYTDINSGGTNGISFLNRMNNVWGNYCVIFNSGLNSERTAIHECGHSLSLPHIFQEGGLSEHVFYQGYTDNYMDYDWKKVSAPDSSDNDFKGKMYSFFKWQWEIMRRDRSLIFNY